MQRIVSRHYWSNHRNSSDWKVGSQWQHQDADTASLVDVTGTILESVRPKRLAFTWSAPDNALEARNRQGNAGDMGPRRRRLDANPIQMTTQNGRADFRATAVIYIIGTYLMMKNRTP